MNPNYMVVTKKWFLPAVAFVLVLVLIIVSLLCTRQVRVANASKRLLPVYCTQQNEKVASITFDAAWGDEDTQELIDILAEYQVRATFFIVGDWVEKFPDSVKALSDAGHEIQNHSDTHPYMSNLDRDEIKEEIQGCNDKIEAITGKRPTLLRPPYGDYNNAVVEVCREMGMECIQWDVDSLDWKGLEAPEITQRVVSKTQPGSILLFHNDAVHTPQALLSILKQLKADGYRFVPVSEILLSGDTIINAEGRQCPAQPTRSIPAASKPETSSASES